jgi:hypothetical protein
MKAKLFEKVSPRYLSKAVSQKENTTEAAPSIPKHSSFGKVPSYLVRMAAEKQQQLEEAEEARRQSEIPAGYRYMTAEEKESSVQDLNSRRRLLLEVIKGLPLQIVTLGQRRRKLELEQRLGEIERTLEKLAYPKVLISS